MNKTPEYHQNISETLHSLPTALGLAVQKGARGAARMFSRFAEANIVRITSFEYLNGEGLENFDAEMEKRDRQLVKTLRRDAMATVQDVRRLTRI